MLEERCYMNAILTAEPTEIDYPDSDGKRMADNTLQFDWIVTIQGNINFLFHDNPDVFVAGDNLWYPVRGKRICQAPDVYVAFGRPKGYRGSYKQWLEGDIAPQVVFEVLSPCNTMTEMKKKRRFYEQYGCEEYIVLDPDNAGEVEAAEVWVRDGDRLQQVDLSKDWVSPRLGIRITSKADLFLPNGNPFPSFEAIHQQAVANLELAESERHRAESEKLKAESEKRKAESEKLKADAERQKAERFAKKLRELGVDPDAV